jgi:hypothetical protein
MTPASWPPDRSRTPRLSPHPLWRDAGGKTVDAADPAAVKQAGFRTHGKSKDSRDDLPQVVVGMAVTRTGIPVRVWCWPGNTGDSTLIRQVKTEMREWSLAPHCWVADRGFASAENRRFLQQPCGTGCSPSSPTPSTARTS